MFGHEAGAFTGATRTRAGRFEEADGGTLFLDELATMSSGAQERLLRAVEYGEITRVGASRPVRVDVRIVAATKDDLRVLSEQGGFRADLYYRLSVATLSLPPLRERREDIPLLFQHFLLQAAARHERPVPPCDPARVGTCKASSGSSRAAGIWWPATTRAGSTSWCCSACSTGAFRS